MREERLRSASPVTLSVVHWEEELSVQFVLMIVVALLDGDGASTSQAILYPRKDARYA